MVNKYEYQEGYENIIDQSLSIEKILEADNIADLLDQESLDTIGKEVIEGYNQDRQTRQHREEKIREAMDLALGVEPDRAKPIGDMSANVIYPLILEAAQSFSARASETILKNDDLVKVKINGQNIKQDQLEGIDLNQVPPQQQAQAMALMSKTAQATRVSKYQNYELMEGDWSNIQDKLLAALPITGCMFKKVYRDQEKDINMTSVIYPTHFIVDYEANSIENAIRCSEEIIYNPEEIISKIRQGQFTDFNFASGTSDESDVSDNDLYSNQQKNALYEPQLFIEQHTRLDLDDDGYTEPYIITVHKDTSKVARIVANFTQSSVKLNSKGEIYKIAADQYYVKYDYMPAPDGGFYGIGLGEMLLQLNVSINSILNRLLDAGTLANTATGFVGSNLKMQGGNVKIEPGKFVKVDARGGTIRDGFVQMQFPQPSPTLHNLLNLLIESGKSLGMLKDVLAGQQIANQPGIATLAMLDQGLTSFKSIYKRIYNSMRKEFRIMFDLNAKYLPDQKYIEFHDFAVSSSDFDMKGMDIYPVADPETMTTQQELIRAQIIGEFKDDPNIDPIQARIEMFNILGIENPERFIKTQPQGPDPIMLATQEQIKTERMKVENQRLDLQLKARKTKAEIDKIIAESLKTLAEAEKEEVGKDLEIYRERLNNLREMASYEQANTGRAEGMEGKSSDGNGVSLPEQYIQ